MTEKQKNILKIIISVAVLLCLAFLPWWLLNKKGESVNKLADKLVPAADTAKLKEAMYYEALNGGRVQCALCPNRCLLEEGQSGLCKARKNIEGKLYSLVYGKPVTIHIDPIEKKPLFHFLPGASAYSLATVGCNLSCAHCQNWDISQAFLEDVTAIPKTPAEVVAEAKASKAEVIAFTYNEPIIFYEYMLDIAKTAKTEGIKTVMISNGYINQEPLLNLLPYLDGIKIDLKAFTNDFYVKISNGRLDPVLDTIKTIHEAKKHLEIVYLIIPGENDSEEEIRNMSKWLYDNLGAEAILHFSRFYPQYKLTNKPPTPIETVKRARAIALEEGLKYVYTGNIEFPEGEATYCADGSIAIERQGFFVKNNNLKDGKCVDGTVVPGVFE
jgi:pyruvate formate lyase activating enzyme